VKPSVTLVDYGIGNLLSVQRGFEYWGINVIVSNDPKVILRSERVVLPGVGSFGIGMHELAARGLDNVIQELAKNEVPLLAICLGMQLLFEYGEEHGARAGLGVIPGSVIAIPTSNDSSAFLRVPHIGWNSINKPTKASTWKAKVLKGIKPGSEVYFNHSFMAIPSKSSDLKAICNYGGHSVSAVVEHGAITGCQFHPEKSGETGLMILKNFVDK
jgi:glutamine amidotransferase